MTSREPSTADHGICALPRQRRERPAHPGALVVRGEIPAELQEKAEEYREALIEAAAEGSDELTEAYLENGELTIEQIKEGVRALTISGRAFPVFCGTALRNMGVQPVLDAVIDYLPSPLDIPRGSRLQARS